MHRSGTSVVAEVLNELGVFTGRDLDGHHEAQLFQGLNDWLFRSSGGAWDQPLSIDLLVADDELRALTARYLRHLVRSPRSIAYLGWRKYLRYRSPDRITSPWGWKDPRNTFTLPLWLEIFPEARIVHVLRHGVDVANSVCNRRHEQLVLETARFRRVKWLYLARPKRQGFVDTMVASSIEAAFALWGMYVDRSRQHVAALGSRALELRYEDVLAHPDREIRRLAAFCELTPSVNRLDAATRQLESGGAMRYREDAGLSSFARSVEHQLEQRGYGA